MRLAAGVSGELRVGYQVAAHLGRWAVDISDERMVDGRWTCTAEAVERNEYRLAHGGPFGLVLDVPPHRWRWQNVTVEVGEVLIIRGQGGPKIGT